MAQKIGPDCGAGEENKMAESEVKELKVKQEKENQISHRLRFP